MGNQKQKWTAEEEAALLAGIRKVGPGKWMSILDDPDFGPFLTHRSNVDLKDKWRNLSVSTATQGSREKIRPPIAKNVTASLIKPVSASNSFVRDASPGIIRDDPSNATRYNTLILEALTSLKDTNGSDIGAIVGFIEQRHEVPQNFRRLLSSKLRRLVTQGKLEKVQNCYKINNETALTIKTPSQKQKDIRPRQAHSSALSSGETLGEAAKAAAYMVADAENRSFVAAEAVKEAERISKMAEETDSMLLLVKEIYEHCLRGEIVILA